MNALDLYRARDLRISIGLPIKQDNGEYAYPGFVDDVLIGLYANIRAARLALDLNLDVMSSAACAMPVDVDYAAFGF